MDKEKTRGTEYLIDIDDIENFGQVWSQYAHGPLMPVYVCIFISASFLCMPFCFIGI
jgi:hypothetical protein